MPDLYCANCEQTIGMDKDSGDDRYWYVANPKYSNDDEEVFCSKQEAIEYYYDVPVNQLGLKYGYVSEL